MYNQKSSFLNPLYTLDQLNRLHTYINLPQNTNFFHTHTLNYILTLNTYNNQSTQFLTNYYLHINNTLQLPPSPSKPTYIQPQPTPIPQQIPQSYNPLPTQPNLTPSQESTPSPLPNPVDSL